MNLEVMLIGNGFFLAAVLIVLLFIFYKKENSPTNTKVKEDLKKIKDQITDS